MFALGGHALTRCCGCALVLWDAASCPSPWPLACRAAATMALVWQSTRGCCTRRPWPVPCCLQEGDGQSSAYGIPPGLVPPPALLQTVGGDFCRLLPFCCSDCHGQASHHTSCLAASRPALWSAACYCSVAPVMIAGAAQPLRAQHRLRESAAPVSQGSRVFAASNKLHAGCDRGQGNTSQQVHLLALLSWQICSLAGREPSLNTTCSKCRLALSRCLWQPHIKMGTPRGCWGC